MCECIIEAGKKLECSTETVATAFVIFHQFMRCADEVHYDSYLVAAASLSLSGKFNEQVLEMRDIVNVFYSMVHREEPVLNSHGKEFDILKKSFSTMELIVGRTLKFGIHYKLAHRYLFHFIKSIADWPNAAAVRQNLITTCMRFISDFYLDKMCLNHRPEHVAVAIIELTLRCYKITLDFCKPTYSWHKALCADITNEKVGTIIDDMLLMYEKKLV